ncbi:hypothetical protein ACH4FA_29640 [Streptomyces sp. NPDC017966]|uniref:hypothetical protein n=1 Tax=Streptomyces sp. NPDC017966 TaxID=3365023 RepID=UPI003793A4AA
MMGPGVAPGTVNALAAEPVLLPLPATLSNPEQRAALLRLYAAEPKATLDPRARRELPLILHAADPAQALRTLLRDGLGVVAQQFAERHLPGSAEAVTVWGPRRLPLAGGSGPRVLRLLVEQREKHGARAGVLTPWLPAAGAGGRAGAERTVRLRRAGPRPRH